MPTANDILNVARTEIGYKESGNNSNKYGQAYGLNNQPWCVIFVWWCFNHASAASLFYGGGKIALCSSLYNYHKARGQAVSTSALRAGDVVFFDFSGRKTATNHVGIVESVSGSTVYTIEGNTSSGNGGSQSNGDGVYRRTRKTSQISCAYRPAYDGATSGGTGLIDTTAEVQTWLNATYGFGLAVDGVYGSNTKKALIKALQKAIGVTADGIVGSKTRAALKTLQKGSTGNAVKALQGFLVCRGYGSYVDGDFGTSTKTAVKSFQKANGLTADGIVGKATWAKLYA